jgi:Zn-dependent protease
VLFKLKFLLSFFGFFALYWAFWGWKFAAGFMACLMIHELGHYFAVRRRGLKAELPMFGLMGAYVRWYAQGVSREDIAAIALAGPMWGLVSALACFSLYWGTHYSLFLVLTYTAAWINLLNLIPLMGLDGAHACYALSQMQRALLAGTCLLFFALTLGPTMSMETAQWVFLFVGLGLLWKVFVRDTPESGDTTTFVVFQSLVILLGLVVLYTYPAVGRMHN